MDLVGVKDLEHVDAAAAPDTQSIQRLRNETMVAYLDGPDCVQAVDQNIETYETGNEK